MHACLAVVLVHAERAPADAALLARARRPGARARQHAPRRGFALARRLLPRLRGGGASLHDLHNGLPTASYTHTCAYKRRSSRLGLAGKT